MTEIGIDVKTMNVARKLRRKRKMMSMTRHPPTSACSWWTGPSCPVPGETEEDIALLAETLPASTIAGLRKQLAQRTAAGPPLMRCSISTAAT